MQLIQTEAEIGLVDDARLAFDAGAFDDSSRLFPRSEAIG
jgi:hypothetical protein